MQLTSLKISNFRYGNFCWVNNTQIILSYSLFIPQENLSFFFCNIYLDRFNIVLSVLTAISNKHLEENLGLQPDFNIYLSSKLIIEHDAHLCI